MYSSSSSKKKLEYDSTWCTLPGFQQPTGTNTGTGVSPLPPSPPIPDPRLLPLSPAPATYPTLTPRVQTDERMVRTQNNGRRTNTQLQLTYLFESAQPRGSNTFHRSTYELYKPTSSNELNGTKFLRCVGLITKTSQNPKTPKPRGMNFMTKITNWLYYRLFTSIREAFSAGTLAGFSCGQKQMDMRLHHSILCLNHTT